MPIYEGEIEYWVSQQNWVQCAWCYDQWQAEEKNYDEWQKIPIITETKPSVVLLWTFMSAIFGLLISYFIVKKIVENGIDDFSWIPIFFVTFICLCFGLIIGIAKGSLPKPPAPDLPDRYRIRKRATKS